MTLPRCLCSPLAGTAGVMAGLALMAVPLHKLTSAAPATRQVHTVESSSAIHAVIRVRLLLQPETLVLKTTDGRMLLVLNKPVAGESEHDVDIPFAGNGFEAVLSADFGDSPSDTAVFLTVMPDGREDQTRYLTGKGKLEETLRFEWPSR